MAKASSSLFWMPRAMRIGATNTSAASRYGRVSGTRPVTVTPRLVAKRRTAAAGRLPQIVKAASGICCCTMGRTWSQNQTTASTLGK